MAFTGVLGTADARAGNLEPSAADSGIYKSGLVLDYKSAGNASTTGATAVTETVPAGTVLVVTTQGSGATGTTTSTVADSKGHTWTGLPKLYNSTTGGGWVQMFYAVITSALVSGVDTLTVTRTGTGGLLAQARYLGGVNTASPLDGTATTGTNTSNDTAVAAAPYSVADGTLIVASAMLSQTTNGVATPGTGFYEEAEGSSTTTNIRSYGSVHGRFTSAATVTPAFTASAACLWAIFAQGFRSATSTASGATQSAAGDASASATIAGDSTRVAGASGTTTTTATIVGDAAVIRAASGDLTAAATTAGAAARTTNADGTLTAAATPNANDAATRPVAGTSSTTATTTGAVTATHTVDGTVAAAAVIAGTPSTNATQNGSGTQSGTATTTGDATTTRPIAGTSSATASLASSASIARGSDGTATAAASVTGSASVIRTAAGDFAAVAATDVAAAANRDVAGTLAALATINGQAFAFLPVPTPPERSHVVAADDRVHVVAVEDRTHVVAADNRTHVVPA